MNSRLPSRSPLEGDFVESTDSLIFDVKGLLHSPDRIVAYVRYVPHPRGERSRQGLKYRKLYDLGQRQSFLNQSFKAYLYFDPVFNREMQGVPRSMVSRYYDPQCKAKQVMRSSESDHLEFRSVEMLDLLKAATGLSTANFGISGSLLVGLHTSTSDIDLVVYGERPSARVAEATRELQREGRHFRPYQASELWKLRESRLMSESIAFQDFARHEKRKSLQGIFRDIDYFIRCVRKPEEVTERYGDRTYLPAGRSTVEAVVEDDSEAIFTPCRYVIDRVRVLEGPGKASPSQIVSFRGRFCQQAKAGERIVAKGCLEKVVSATSEYFQLVVGEDQSDCFIARGQ